MSALTDNTAAIQQLIEQAESLPDASGGVDQSDIHYATLTGGMFHICPSAIVFVDGMTWEEYCSCGWNRIGFDQAGTLNMYSLKIHNGRICVGFTNSPPYYLARNDDGYISDYTETPQTGDIVVSPTDPIVADAKYWTRSDGATFP